ncbi:MAG: ATP-binding cassette domain-containing protein [Bifidobacteriaceae bacterium]|nr:ATP-binding cassette domain-containing protein [Bifidobacteriaceae bacterium]
MSRTFGAVKALDDVSFDVQPGRLTGFVGANGAGKTTAMRIIMGVLGADSGEVTFDGAPVTLPVAARFGYMPEERGLYPKMALRQQLVFFARLHGLPADKAEANTDGLLERLGLAGRAKDMVEKLSLGNQQRAQIAAALVHDPTALVLDEPFSGLDPMAVDVVMDVLRGFADKGAPILFSSHQLDVVERITDDLVVISGGRVRASGATAALRQAYAGSRYRLVLQGVDDAAWLARVPGVTEVRLEPAAEVTRGLGPGGLGTGRALDEQAQAGGAGPAGSRLGGPEIGLAPLGGAEGGQAQAGGAGSASLGSAPTRSGDAELAGAGRPPTRGTGRHGPGDDDGVTVTFDASANVAQTVLGQALARGPVLGFERLVPPLSEVFKEVAA